MSSERTPKIKKIVLKTKTKVRAKAKAKAKAKASSRVRTSQSQRQTIVFNLADRVKPKRRRPSTTPAKPKYAPLRQPSDAGIAAVAAQIAALTQSLNERGGVANPPPPPPPPGAIGPAGPPGIRGVEGLRGIPGVRGNEGVRGVEGVRGIPGERGTPGHVIHHTSEARPRPVPAFPGAESEPPQIRYAARDRQQQERLKLTAEQQAFFNRQYSADAAALRRGRSQQAPPRYVGGGGSVQSEAASAKGAPSIVPIQRPAPTQQGVSSERWKPPIPQGQARRSANAAAGGGRAPFFSAPYPLPKVPKPNVARGRLPPIVPVTHQILSSHDHRQRNQGRSEGEITGAQKMGEDVILYGEAMPGAIRSRHGLSEAVAVNLPRGAIAPQSPPVYRPRVVPPEPRRVAVAEQRPRLNVGERIQSLVSDIERIQPLETNIGARILPEDL